MNRTAMNVAIRSALLTTLTLALASCSSNNSGSAVSEPTKPFVLAYTDGQDPQSYTNLQHFHASISAVALSSAYGLLADGTLDLSGITPTTTSIIAYGKSQQIPLYATVSDYSNAITGFDPNIILTVAASPALTQTAVTNLVDLAVSNGFAGIDLDIEQVGMEAGGPTAADTANFSAFVTSLAAALHARGLKLIESIPPTDGTSNFSWLGGYNYAALGAQVDYLQVMTYDEVGPGWSSSSTGTWPGPCSGLDWMKRMMSYAVTQVAPQKILLGLPTYGYDFSTGGQQTWAADSHQGTLGFIAYIQSKQATTNLDATSDTPYANWGPVTPQSAGWTSATAQPSLWFDNVASIKAKVSLVNTYQLGGTGVWAMGYEDASFWAAHDAGLTVTP